MQSPIWSGPVRALILGRSSSLRVSAETLRVAARAAETIPPDTLFTEVERPPWGSPCSKRPSKGPMPKQGGTVVVDADVVGPCVCGLSPALTTWGSAATRSAATSAVRGSAHLAEEMPDDLVPIDGPDWLADDPIDVVGPRWILTRDGCGASMVEDRRLHSVAPLDAHMDSERHTTWEAWVLAQQEGTAPVRRHPRPLSPSSASGVRPRRPVVAGRGPQPRTLRGSDRICGASRTGWAALRRLQLIDSVTSAGGPGRSGAPGPRGGRVD